MSKAREWPGRWQMPGPQAVQNLQMPHLRDWQGGQMPHSCPVCGGGGGWGGLGAGGIDWCITGCLNIPISPGFSQFGVRLVVGGQEQKHFSPLGTELYFFVNYSRKNAIVLTHNMVALSRGCKPGRCDRDRTKPDFDICSETFKWILMILIQETPNREYLAVTVD